MHSSWKKYLRIFFLTILVIVAFILILYGVAKWYVHANKQAILAELKIGIQKKYSSAVNIKDLELGFFSTFPNLSLELDSVDVIGSLYKVHGRKLFTASKIRVSVLSHKLLLGKLRLGKTAVEHGSIFIYTDKNGLSNLNFLTTKETQAKKTEENFDLPKLTSLKQTSIELIDLQKEKHYHLYADKLIVKTTNSNTVANFNINLTVDVKQLSFNTPRGSFIKDKKLLGDFSVSYNTSKKQIELHDVLLTIDKQPFIFSGLFSLGANPSFQLVVTTKQVGYEFAKTLVLPHIAKALSIVSLDQPLDVETKISGPLNGGEPLIIANWKVANTALTTPLINIDSASFSGLYTNEVIKGKPRKDSNSKIELSSLTGKWEGIPFTAQKITVLNLSKPIVKGAFGSSFNLNTFNNVVKSDALYLSNGTGKLSVQYEGPLDSITKKNASIDIRLLIAKGSIALLPLNLSITDCVTDIDIRNADISINNLSANTSDGTKITLWGKATNALTLLDENPGAVNTNIHIYSPYLNLNNISKVLRGKTAAKIRRKKTRFTKSIERIDTILAHEPVALDIKADKIKHGKLNASNLDARAKLEAGKWNIEQARFNFAGGDILVKAKLEELGGINHKIVASATVHNVDAPALFYAFENFGLPGISDRNISGKIALKTAIETFIDKHGNFPKHGITGQLSFSLKNGSINHLPALLELQQKYFKKRDLSNLQFAEIKNTISVKDGLVAVPRMQIESSAFRLFIEGIYGITGNTDLRIQVPLSNLTAPDSGYIPKKTLKNRKGGASIYLRAKTGDDGKLKIGIDAFGAIRKSNVKRDSPIHP